MNGQAVGEIPPEPTTITQDSGREARILMRRIANEEHCDRETASVVWTHGGIWISIETGRLSELE